MAIDVTATIEYVFFIMKKNSYINTLESKGELFQSVLQTLQQTYQITVLLSTVTRKGKVQVEKLPEK